jgi:hypothetical protein
MSSVSIELASQEVEKWLDCKRISPRKREKFADSIENLIEGFQDGILTLNEESNEITHHLIFPDGETKELVFKSQLNVGEIHNYLKQVKPGDGDGRVKAYISALTGKPSAIINRLDSEDYNVSAQVAVFFF